MTDTRRIMTTAGPIDVITDRPRSGAPQGAVVVVPDRTGVDRHIRNILRRFAESGYVALAPDLLPLGEGGAAPSREAAVDVINGALALLHEEGWSDEQNGIVGYGTGGGIAFVVAAARPLGAAVSLYPLDVIGESLPGLTHLPNGVLAMRTPWLGQFGVQDDLLPGPQIDELRALLDHRSGAFTEIVRHEGAGHRFDVDGSPGHTSDAAFESWERTLEWLECRLEPPPTEFAAAAHRMEPTPDG